MRTLQQENLERTQERLRRTQVNQTSATRVQARRVRITLEDNVEAESPDTSAMEPAPTDAPLPEWAQTSSRQPDQASPSRWRWTFTKESGVMGVFYLAVFFIVAAALAFVGFGSVSGGVKSLVMVVLTTCFAAGGLVLARSERMRIAGLVFIGLCLLFVPLDGVVIYYFTGRIIGLVWCVTSVIFVALCAFFYRTVARHQVLVGFIIAGFLSTLFSLVYMAIAPLSWYAAAAVAMGFALEALARQTHEYQKLYKRVAVRLVAVGCAVGYLCSLPKWGNVWSEFFGALVRVSAVVTTGWLAVLFAAAGFIFDLWRFISKRSNEVFLGVIGGIILTVATVLLVAQAPILTWCLTGVVLAFFFDSVIWSLPDFFAQSEIDVLRFFSAFLLNFSAGYGIFRYMVPQYSFYFLHMVPRYRFYLEAASWSTGYPAFLLGFLASVYYIIHFMVRRRNIELNALVIWLSLLLGVVLYLNQALPLTWLMTYALEGLLFYTVTVFADERRLFPTGQLIILDTWSFHLVSWASFLGGAYQFLSAGVASEPRDWWVVVFAAIWLVFHGARYLRQPTFNRFFGALVGTQALLGAYLFAQRASAFWWGISFDVLAIVYEVAAAWITNWQKGERKLLCAVSVITLMVTYLCLLATYGSLAATPVVFSLILLGWASFHYYQQPTWEGRFLTWLISILCGWHILSWWAMQQGVILFEAYFLMIAQGLTLFFLGVSVWFLAADQSQERRISDFFFLGASYLLSLIFFAIAQLSAWQLFLAALTVSITYPFAAKYVATEERYFWTSGLWLVWWWMFACRLHLAAATWYIQPVLAYLVAWSAWRGLRGHWTSTERTLAAIAVGISALLGYVGGWSGDYQLTVGQSWALVEGLIFFVLSYVFRDRLWRRTALIIIVGVAYSMTYTWIWGLPIYFWWALIGAGLLALAIWLLYRNGGKK